MTLLAKAAMGWVFAALVSTVFADELNSRAEEVAGPDSGGVRLKLDYIYVEEGTDLDLPAELTENSEVEEFIESLDGDVYQTERVDAPALGSSSGNPDAYDFVGDRNGESGIASEQPIWQGTFADTLVETQLLSSPRPPSEEARYGAGRTTFGDGYIPEFEEVLRLADDEPHYHDYAQAGSSARLPDDWAVPPGSSRDIGYDRRNYAGYGTYDGQGYDGSPDYRPGYSYNDTYYPTGGSYEGEYLHPEGPYGYRTGVNDPFWAGRRGYYEDAGYTFSGGIPFFVRNFDPEEAHLKAGPFYLQVVAAEVGVLYSDYDGPTVFPKGEEDGWLGFASLHLRAAARLAPNLYFTLSGEVIYIFGENRFGLRSSDGGVFAQVEYETEIGMWDVRFYDRLGSYLPFTYSDGAYDRAGRYSFGFLGYDRGVDNVLYDPVIYNQVGIQAVRPVNPDWFVEIQADHTDYFHLGDERDEDHTSREHAGVRLASVTGAVEGNPYVSYDVYSDDYFDSARHTVYLGGSEQVSESLFVDGRVGYLWNTGDRNQNGHWLWDIGLRHRISGRTFHGIRVGQDFFINDFTDDSVVSSFAQYYINHQVSERTNIYGFAQWSSDEFLTGRLVGGEYDTEIYGVWVTHAISERVTGRLGYRYESRSNTATGEELERKIFNADLDARIARQATGYLRYQFEDDELFDEDLYMAGVRRYF